MIFQTLDCKEKNFLDLLNNEYLPIKLTYIKDGTWLDLLEHSNTLCTGATRAIMNHTLIGKYHLKFFPKESFKCLYRSYSIKMRHHILHKCRRFNNYWNPNKESLKYFVTFLEFNLEAFSFHEEIT